jgi:type IV pilus assembly protein PilV
MMPINQSGFSMLELLIALIVLSVGLLALAGLQQTAIESNAASQHLTSSTFLAESKMHELKTDGYASLSNGTFSDANNPIDEEGQAGGIFTRTWTVSTMGVNTKQVAVTISWQDQIGGYRSSSLHTIVSDTMD